MSKKDRPVGERMRAALRAVRFEAWKAATIYAVVDAVALFLVVNLLVAALEPSAIPEQVGVPDVVTETVTDSAGVPLSDPTVPGSALVALAVGLVVFVAELVLRLRRPLIEQFEAVNPSVAEALRTARDAITDEQETAMAVRLYEDVLAQLRETSGVALVNIRRLAVTLFVIAILSLATVQVAAVDLALLDGNGGATPANGGPDQPRDYTGLEDGDSVLGDSEDVTAGDENLTAQIESTGGEEEVDPTQQFPSEAGGDVSGDFESQQAGFAGAEDLEDAELIREYNLRIREDGESDT
ncbi:hypothetical protein ACFQJ5_13425 [Halomicroarcula sp. GCM10025324]|uniref:DUF7502 family protein n=1 Tax=Haloarcula TaxID=2237 RepID=UPI0023E8A0CB|nr:hypothetical protein [Halomicroarcula sp. ZS-22-S1]